MPAQHNMFLRVCTAAVRSCGPHFAFLRAKGFDPLAAAADPNPAAPAVRFTAAAPPAPPPAAAPDLPPNIAGTLPPGCCALGAAGCLMLLVAAPGN